MSVHNLHEAALACLLAADPDEKVRLSRENAEAWRTGSLALRSDQASRPLPQPGRPARLRLVLPRDLPRRSPATREGRAVLFHALVHIEFNAIDLAWDAVYRFQDMPSSFYDDWVRVAEEEAYHFSLLRDHLRRSGCEYGDYPAHNGLWEMAVKTAHDVLTRMALVPRCLEARGLDVNPGIKARLLAHGDTTGAALLDVIMRDEIGHVAIGDRWFRLLCEGRGLDPESTYRKLVTEYMKTPLRGPFSLQARRKAGFSEAELAYLEGAG